MRTLLNVLVVAAFVPSIASAGECSVLQAAQSTEGCTALVLRPSLQHELDRNRELTDKENEALRIRNAGIALTLIGTVATVAGAIMATSNLCLFGDNCTESSESDLINNAGIGLFAAGQVSAVAGISMWAAGGAKASNAERAHAAWNGAGLKVTF